MIAWIGNHIKLIGLMIVGLLLAILGQQALGSRMAARASRLSDDNAPDEAKRAEARRRVASYVENATVAQTKAAAAVENARTAHREAIEQLVKAKPEDMNDKQLMNYLNRGV